MDHGADHLHIDYMLQMLHSGFPSMTHEWKAEAPFRLLWGTVKDHAIFKSGAHCPAVYNAKNSMNLTTLRAITIANMPWLTGVSTMNRKRLKQELRDYTIKGNGAEIEYHLVSRTQESEEIHRREYHRRKEY